MKKGLALLMALLVLALAACNTTPATHVTSTSAQLNGQGGCIAGLHAYWWYEYRTADPFSVYGPWQQTSRHRADCAASSTADAVIASNTVYGLTPDKDYQYRIAYRQDGGATDAVCDSLRKCVFKGPDESTLVYTQFSTEADTAGDIGQDYIAGSALPAVSAQKCLRWHHNTHYGAGGEPDPTTGGGSVTMECNRLVTLTCTIEVGVKEAGDLDEDTASGDEGTRCFAHGTVFRFNDCGRMRHCAGSAFGFAARLNNPDRRWSQGYTNGDRPNEGCETYRISGNDVIECVDIHGNPFWGDG